MPVEFIRKPDGLGEPLGRYSQISIATGTQIVAVAGQVGITASGELAGHGGLTAQTRQAFQNVATALKSAGLGMQDIFKTTTYLVGPTTFRSSWTPGRQHSASCSPTASSRPTPCSSWPAWWRSDS